MMRKVAAHRLILPDGQILVKEVVSIDDDGKVLEHHPLLCEEAGVEWYCGDYEIR